MAEHIEDYLVAIPIAVIRIALDEAPAYRDDNWDASFAERSAYLRAAIDDMVAVDDAVYTGTVGDHSLALGPIEAHSDDGYRMLLLDWIAAAQLAAKAVAK